MGSQLVNIRGVYPCCTVTAYISVSEIISIYQNNIGKRSRFLAGIT
jgi:hypothetical protein